MPLHIRPFRGKNAVHHGVTDRPVTPGRVMADYTVLSGAECRNRPLGGEVEIVSPQPDDLAPQRLKRVCEQKQFARRVDVAALPACCIPGIADLNSIDVGRDIVVPRAPHDRARH